MTDYRSDARIAATLLREMQEELFGLEEIDNTVKMQSAADPMHPSRLSGADALVPYGESRHIAGRVHGVRPESGQR